MKTQTRLTELDATKLANLRLRQQLLTNEAQALDRELLAAYSNPDEDVRLNPDNTLTRTPRPVAAPAPAPKGKGARKTGNK
jgi:hypothetical protein